MAGTHNSLIEENCLCAANYRVTPYHQIKLGEKGFYQWDYSLIGPGLVQGLNLQFLPLIFNPGSKGARKCCPTPHSVWWQKSGAKWAFFSATPYSIWLTASTSSSKSKPHDIIPKEWLTLDKCFDYCQNKFKYLGVWFDKMADHQISGRSDKLL